MGFIYCKSLKASLFRINPSKSGAGLSASVPGFPPGVDLASRSLTFTVIRGELRNFETHDRQETH
jgi:hypothetical protein